MRGLIIVRAVVKMGSSIMITYTYGISMLLYPLPSRSITYLIDKPMGRHQGHLSILPLII